jgi:hypothetical protein
VGGSRLGYARHRVEDGEQLVGGDRLDQVVIEADPGWPRRAFGVVTRQRVVELFRNPVNAAGEVNAGGPVGARGKISCLDQPLRIPGCRRRWTGSGVVLTALGASRP